jgi:plasmid stabilization system protein ParE
MIRTLVVDEDVAEEAEAQARYYWERGGEAISLRFVAELEAAYRGLTEGRLVGVNHPSVRFRQPIKTRVSRSISVRSGFLHRE